MIPLCVAEEPNSKVIAYNTKVFLRKKIKAHSTLQKPCKSWYSWVVARWISFWHALNLNKAWLKSPGYGYVRGIFKRADFRIEMLCVSWSHSHLHYWAPRQLEEWDPGTLVWKGDQTEFTPAQAQEQHAKAESQLSSLQVQDANPLSREGALQRGGEAATSRQGGMRVQGTLWFSTGAD